jgi:hypothetical protein
LTKKFNLFIKCKTEFGPLLSKIRSSKIQGRKGAARNFTGFEKVSLRGSKSKFGNGVQSHFASMGD